VIESITSPGGPKEERKAIPTGHPEKMNVKKNKAPLGGCSALLDWIGLDQFSWIILDSLG